VDREGSELGCGSERPLVIRITDSKPGHMSQTAGLVAALRRIRPLDTLDVPALGHAALLRASLGGKGSWSDFLGRHPLIICCGHSTHLTALALRRALGGRAVTLMRPSVPLGLFDLAVIPEHDSPARDPKVIPTTGVLNPMSAAGPHDLRRGVFLIGGPSRRHGWESAALLEQIRSVAISSPATEWVLTDSRRTPAATFASLASETPPRTTLVPRTQTGPGWVAEQLAAAGTAWITEDSVSMVYEALTAGVAVGLLSVPRLSQDRVTRGIDALVKNGQVVRFEDWQAGLTLHAATPPLAEADRVAAEIVRRGLL